MSNYVLVQNNEIIEDGPVPPVWNDGERDWDMRGMSDTELAGLGWYKVIEVPQPVNTETTTFDYSIELVDSVPTEVWTERDKTAQEIENETSVENTNQMRTESDEAVDKLILVVENLNLITDMTNAAINQNAAAVIKDLAREVKTVARQANREARMTSGRTESTDTGEIVDA